MCISIDAHVTHHVVWQTEGVLTGPDYSRAVSSVGAGCSWKIKDETISHH